MTRMYKALLAAVVASLGCVPILSAADPAASTSVYDAGAATPAGTALHVGISELNVDGAPLYRVLNYLRDATGSNIVVNWKVLEAANVTKDTPITLSVRDLPLRKLLRLVLDQASPSLPLTWTIDSNVIEITSQEEADKILITRVYIVDDLVMTDNQVTQPPQFNLQQITQNGTSGGTAGASANGAMAGGGGGLFTQTNTNTTPLETTEQRGQELAKLVESIIRPDIWRDNGGTCSIRYFSGKLIVTAPQSVQEMIGGASLPEGGQHLGL